MREVRRHSPSSLEDQHVLERVGQVILPADDVADLQIGVVGAGSQVIRRRAIASQQGEVLDISVAFAARRKPHR